MSTAVKKGLTPTLRLVRVTDVAPTIDPALDLLLHGDILDLEGRRVRLLSLQPGKPASYANIVGEGGRPGWLLLDTGSVLKRDPVIVQPAWDHNPTIHAVPNTGETPVTNTAHDNDGKVSTSKTPSLEVSLQDPATAGLLPDLDKKQLAVIADHLQIVGRSRMNKDQLVEAITPKLPQPGDAAAAPAAAPAKVQGAAKKAAQAKAAGGSKQVDPNFKGMVPDDAAAVPTKASPKAAPAKAVVESCEKCGFRFPKPQARTTCRSTDACQRRQDGKASRGTSASGTGGQANTARAERAAAANKEAKALKAWEKGDEATRGDRPATPNLDAINGDVAAQAS